MTSNHDAPTDGSQTTLIGAILAADSTEGDTIILPANSTFTLSPSGYFAPVSGNGSVNTGLTLLPGINQPITIDGNGSTITVADGAAGRFFSVNSNLTLNNVNLIGGVAQGGNGGAGGAGGGGGGAGLGGAIFVNGPAASLTMNQSSIAFSSAIGGAGGAFLSYTTGPNQGGLQGVGGGGGGGLGGNGANGGNSGNTNAGGGGGGPVSSATGQAGGDGVGGNGGNGGNPGTNGASAISFGGGGGGGGSANATIGSSNGGSGGNGNFGGGGGSSGFRTAGGNGGFGGGGGATALGGVPGTGGAFAGNGGNNSSFPEGGGGAGLGGAIFNYQGTVTLNNVSLVGNAATGGSGFNAGTGAGGAIFNYSGAVTLNNATLADNTATAGGGFVFYGGTNGNALSGGIYNYKALSLATPTVSLFNSALANNQVITQGASGPNAPAQSDIVNGSGGTVTANGTNHNFIGASSGTISGGTVLSGLAYLDFPGRFGGYVMTPPEPGSPLAGVADPSTSLSVDETGAARSVTTPTIGAYEGALPSPFPLSAGTVLVTDSSLGGLFAIDPTTGNRETISAANVIGSGPALVNPTAVALDGNSNIYVVDASSVGGNENEIFKVDLTTGNRTLLSGSENGTGPAFQIITDVAYDSASGSLLVTDSGAQAIYTVDPTTGNRTILSNNTTPNGTNPFGTPNSIVYNNTAGIVEGDQYFNTTTYDSALLQIASNGARTVFSDDTTPTTANQIGSVAGIANNSDGTILAIDNYSNPSGSPNPPALYSVASTGTRTLLATLPTTANNGDSVYEYGVAAGPNGIYVTQTGTGSADNQVLLVFDGTVTELAGNNLASGPFFGTGLNIGIAVVPSTSTVPLVSAISLNSGPLAGGTTVTITGTNLQNATEVDFGSNAATIVSDTPNSITVIVPASTSGTPGTVDVTVTTESGSSATSSADQFTYKATPTITWVNPGDITYGTSLSATQLDATANVPGTFVYAPAVGSVLGAGSGQALTVTFTPTDSTDYTTATYTVYLNVTTATPIITWANPGDITYGTALSGTELNAIANVPGTFTYSPVAGTVLGVGSEQALTVTFTPTDSTNYVPTTYTAYINVTTATPIITWANPGDITYGTPLSGTELNATADVPGSFTYSPAVGTVLGVGSEQALTVTFTPTDTVDYVSTTYTAYINVTAATPTITWANPGDITYGTALDATELNATADVPGTFDYTPAAGTVLGAGSEQALTVTFTPTDTTDYTTATYTAYINVTTATPTITWADPADITYGTALSATQLDATASVPGTFDYTPAVGTVLGAGSEQALTVTFTPTDTKDYTTTTYTVYINVTTATPTITWVNPGDITYGTSLSATQLDATANVPGTFVYAPAVGSVLGACSGQALTVTFTPTDSTDYTTATYTVYLNVTTATSTITWADPADITYGTALGATQLNATASVPGTFVYTPAAGTMLGAGSEQTLTVTFIPTDSTDYTTTTYTVTINVNPAVLTVTANDASMVYGAAVPMLTVSYSGFVNGDSAASLTTTPYVSTPATSASPVGSYPITAAEASDPNYTFNYVSGTLAVLPASQTITFPSVGPLTYGESPITLTATGGLSGQAVVFRVISGPGTVSGNQLIVNGPGDIVVEADQIADGNYAAAPPVLQTITVGLLPQIVPAKGASQPVAPPPVFAIGSDAGVPTEVKIYNATTGSLLFDLHPFGSFAGGARVAVSDFEGTPIVIVGAGPGGGSQINVYNGATGQLLTAFYGLLPRFNGGVYVSAATSSSGQNWIAVGAGAGGGPQVAVYDLQQLLSGVVTGPTPTPVTSFFAFIPTFTGGVSVALGDVNGDGNLDVIAGAGPGGGPQVVVVDGTKFSQAQSNGMFAGSALLSSFYAYRVNFTGGVFVSGGMTTGGQFDLITGAGPRGGPQVVVIDGAQVAQTQSDGEIASSAVLDSFYAFPSKFTGGVRVGYSEAYGSNGQPTILTSAGPSSGPQVAPFDDATFQSMSNFYALQRSITSGLFISG